jgi:hypothetical protein
MSKSKLKVIVFHRQRKSTINQDMILEYGELFVELPDDAPFENELEPISRDDLFIFYNSMLCDYKIGDGKTKWKDLEYTGKIPAAIKQPSSEREKLLKSLG